MRCLKHALYDHTMVWKLTDAGLESILVCFEHRIKSLFGFGFLEEVDAFSIWSRGGKCPGHGGLHGCLSALDLEILLKESDNVFDTSSIGLSKHAENEIDLCTT